MGFPLSISKDSLHKLLEEVSKTINNLDIPTKSASSAFSATPETSTEQLQGALSELEAYFSLSVGAALLDEATLLGFKQASELLVHKPGFLGGIDLGDHYKTGVSLPVQQLRGTEKVRVPLRGTIAKLLPVLSSICISVHFPVGSVAHSIKQSPPCLYESPGPAHQNQTRSGVSKSAHDPS